LPERAEAYFKFFEKLKMGIIDFCEDRGAFKLFEKIKFEKYVI